MAAMFACRAPSVERDGGGGCFVYTIFTSLDDFFVGGRYSIADVALYAYTHVAHEGGFDLSTRPSVRAWLARVSDQPGMLGIEDV